MASIKVAFVASNTPDARRALGQLTQRYGAARPEEAEVIVALGGDGFMLEAQHAYLALGKPIYGMNCGTVGFLMNEYRAEGLVERLERAHCSELHPLRMTALAVDGESHEALAMNEVSLLRESRQAAKIEVRVDGVVRVPELICDGVLVSTPAGSSAYNFSAHGPIIPLGANVLALTAISVFRPRRWRGALLPLDAQVRFTIIERSKRPVSATADFTEVRDVAEVDIVTDSSVALHLLFDPEHNLEERILREQFAT